MRSKNRITYENRMLHHLADLELVDVFNTLNAEEKLVSEDSSTLFAKLQRDKHPVLSGRKNVRRNRELAIYHLRQTVYSAFIKEIYEELYRFLKSTIFEAVQNLKVDPDRLLGEQKINLSAKEILKLSNITAVNEKIIDTLFQALEAEQSTIKLITKTRDKLGLQFDDCLINEALPYLELRHKLVHADGKLDADFRSKYPMIPCTTKGNANLRYTMMQEAYEKITALVVAIDEDALKKRLVNNAYAKKDSAETSK